jgi:purine-binding chemotaxis protein CheW
LAWDFDHGFASAPSDAALASDAFLAVRIGGDAYALTLAHLAGLFIDRPIVPVPGTTPGFLGLVGLRGRILPAYGLRAFLGYPSDAAPRWFALAGQPAQVALAFDQFSGHLRVRRDDVQAVTENARAPSYVRATVRSSGAVCAVVDIPSVLEEIVKRSRHDHS